jgi:hypothetical protein
MTGPLRNLVGLLVLPLRAPALLLLALACLYLGVHWSAEMQASISSAVQLPLLSDFYLPMQFVQAIAVVLVCTMPNLLMREVSAVMAISRVVSLVVTLLLVITGGLYLLHLSVLANVLILASSVLLARLDLARVRVVPHPLVAFISLCLWCLAMMAAGRFLYLQHPGIAGTVS